MRRTYFSLGRPRLSTTAATLTATGALLIATASAALAAGGSLSSDLEVGVNGTQKSIDLGTLGPSTAKSQSVGLDITGNADATTYQITGATPAGATVPASMDAVSVVVADTAPTLGVIKWTTPAAAASTSDYTVTVEFAASPSDVNTQGATVTINFSIAGTGGTPAPDGDGDGITDGQDNCPLDANSTQADGDGDGIGDACDTNKFAPAVLTSAGDVTEGEGTTLTTGGAFSDADGANTLTIEKVSGVGTVTGNPDGTWSWSYEGVDDGNGTVQVRATDGDSTHAAATDSFDWRVENVNPTVESVTLGGNTGTSCLTGNAVTLDFGFSDPGVEDADWSVDIDWGDGAPHTTYDSAGQGMQAQQSHSYGVGTYTVGITVTDKDGGVGTGGSAAGAVSHRYNMSGILAPFNADGTSVWKYGSTIPVKVKVTDCDAKPVSGLNLRVGTQLLSSASPTDGIAETVSTSAADSTGQMRYDADGGQYIYNFASKGLADGSARYMMYVRDAHFATASVVDGVSDSGSVSAGQSFQKFGLRLK